jgi:hypothetical protein
MSKYFQTVDVAELVLSKVITHNLNSTDAKLSCALPMYPWMTAVKIASRTLDTMTLEFTNQSPVGGGKLDVRVIKP